jgi:hypothetical protein
MAKMAELGQCKATVAHITFAQQHPSANREFTLWLCLFLDHIAETTLVDVCRIQVDVIAYPAEAAMEAAARLSVRRSRTACARLPAEFTQTGGVKPGTARCFPGLT